MKASLIISVYTNTEFLKAVLDSLKKQTIKDFEIIISEDGESEVMGHFIRSYPFEQSCQHLTQSDTGWRKNRALNRAILAAKADYLIFIDGDCVLHPRFIEMHLKYAKSGVVLGGKRIKLNESISARIISGDLAVENVQSELLHSFFNLKALGFKFHEEGFFIDPKGLLNAIPKLRRINQLKGCNMSFAKATILEINGFDEDYVLPAIGEDIDLTWRFKLAGYSLKSLRNLAIQYHLYHKEIWSDQSENIEKMERNKADKKMCCTNGILKTK